MMMYLAIYILIGALLVLPALDDLTFFEVIPAVIFWPIGLIFAAIMMSKKGK